MPFGSFFVNFISLLVIFMCYFTSLKIFIIADLKFLSTDYITSVISGWVSMHWFFLVLNASFAYLVLKVFNLSGRQLNYLRTVWLFWGLVLSPVKVTLGYL